MPVTLDAPPSLPTVPYEIAGNATPPMPEATAKEVRAKIDPASLPDANRAATMRTLGYSPSEIAQVEAKVDLGAKLKGAVTKLIERQAANRPLEIKTGEIAIGQHAGIAANLNLTWIPNDDPRIAQDPARAAYDKASGDRPLWIAAGGAVLPHAGISTTIGGVQLGFSADATLSYSILRPYRAELSEAKRLASNASVDLPLTLKKMQETEPGTELVIIGRGRMAGSAGVAAGQTLASGRAWSVGASVGASVDASEEKLLMLRVKRLHGENDVYAQVSVVDTEQWSVGVRGFLGVDANVGELLGGGKLIDRAAEAIDRKIENLAKVEASIVYTATDVDQDRAAFVFGNRGRDADAAFKALFNFDPSLASGDDARFFGVRQARLEQRIQSGAIAIDASAGPFEIIAYARRLASETATFTRTGEDGKTSIIKYRAIDLDKSYSGLISNLFLGARGSQRTLISLEENGVTKRYYHLRHSIEGDGVTTKADLRSAVAMAEIFGAIDDAARARIQDPKVRQLFSGKTTRVMDVSIDDAGLLKVVGATSEERLAAHAKVFAATQGVDVAPWLNTALPDFAYWQNAIIQGPQARTDMGYPNDASDFYRLTKIDLRVAHEAYEEGRRFDAMIGQLEGKSIEDQVRILRDGARQLRISPFGTFGTAALIAGPEHVLVHEMRIKGKDGEMSLKSEGAAVDPRTAIEQGLEAR
jgi:hypothetical protein